MSDGSRVDVYYSPETVYGVTDANPEWTKLRVESVSLSLTKEIVSFDTIRSDREDTDERHGTRQAGGDIVSKLAYGEFDPLLEASYCGTWGPKATITGTTISADATDNSFNDSGNGFVTAGFEVGDIINVNGYTGGNAALTGDYTITAVSAGKITIGGTDGDAIVTEAAGDSVTIADQDRLLIGTTRRSFSFMLHFADQASGDKPYHIYTGGEINGNSLGFAINSGVSVTFPIIAQDVSYNTAAPSGSTYVAASSNKPFDNINATINEGGSSIATVTEFSPTLENGLETKFSIGSAITSQASINKSKSSGSLSVYFDDSSMMEKFKNETESSFDIELTDPSGNKLKLEWPRTKINGAEVSISPGVLIQTIPVKALLGSTAAASSILTRNPA